MEISKFGLALVVSFISATVYGESRFGRLFDHGRSAGSLERRADPSSSGIVPSNQFLRRGYHNAAVAGDWIYIDGGDFSYTDSGETQYPILQTTLAIPLGTDWTNSTVAIQSIEKGPQVPSLAVPSLWQYGYGNVLYADFSGGPSFDQNVSEIPGLSLWAFTPHGSGSVTWANITTSDDSNNILQNYTRQSGGLQSYSPTSAYVLGGVAPDGTWLPGLVEFDFASQQFTNHSTLADAPDLVGINKGVMQYVPSFGPQGLFVVMGGWTKNGRLMDFGTVKVYDPAAQAWYNQTTTGSNPTGRVEFCSAGVNSTNSTFEIFVYAGWDGINYGIEYDTIYILTLPAFHWLQVEYTPTSSRFAHTCHAVGGSQVLTIGGLDANPKITGPGYQNLIESNFNSTPDPHTLGLGVFDMTTLTWASQYTANKSDYEQSEIVSTFYNQTNKAYVENLNQNVLALIDVTHFTTPASQNTSTPHPSPHNSSGPGAGTIAGAVVGSVVGLALIAGLIFFFLRRRRNQRSRGEYEKPPNAVDEKSNDGSAGYFKAELPNEERHFSELGGSEAREMDGNTSRQEMEAWRGQEVLGHQPQHEMAG